MLNLNDKDPLNTHVQTRDGRKARLICVDRKDRAGGERMIALVQEENGHERCILYFGNGDYFDDRESTDDLVNIPQKITRYANIYRGEQGHYPGGVLYGTPEAAKEAVTNTEAYIATAKVEFEV